MKRYAIALAVAIMVTVSVFSETITPQVEWPAFRLEDRIVIHKGFVASYNEAGEYPYWVAYRVEADKLNDRKHKRPGSGAFRPDPAVDTKTAHPLDYKGSGFDRGHLAPAIIFAHDKDALRDSFLMSNIAPQYPALNRGTWAKLESQVRKWARRYSCVAVVTGTIAPFGGTGAPDILGKYNTVKVPQMFYKALMIANGKEIQTIAFVVANSKKPLKNKMACYAVSIDLLEDVTGMDFFPILPDEVEDAAEAKLKPGDWLDDYNPRRDQLIMTAILKRIRQVALTN